MDQPTDSRRSWVAVSSDGMPVESRQHFAGWEALLNRICISTKLFANEQEATTTAIAGASALITCSQTAAWESVRRCQPCILLGTIETPEPPDPVKLMRADTRFLADLHLASILTALAEIDSNWVEQSPRNSRAELVPHLHGRVAHIGHRGEKIAGALGIDRFRQDPEDWCGDGRDLWFLESQSFGSVLLEVIEDQMTHLQLRIAEATRILQFGGTLILRVPMHSEVEEHLCARAGLVRKAQVDDTMILSRHRGRSFFEQGGMDDQPLVSVLIVSELHEPAAIEAPRLRASIEAAHRSLGRVPHEILVLQRQRFDSELQANLRSCALGIEQCQIIEDLRPSSYGRRYERLREIARAPYLLMLSSGSLPLGDALLRMLGKARIEQASAIEARLYDPRMFELDPIEARTHCLLLSADAWRIGSFEHSPYRGDRIWHRLLIELEQTGKKIRRCDQAIVLSAAAAGRSLRGHAASVTRWDRHLIDSHVPIRAEATPRRILVSLLRTMGDCILGSTVLDALAARYPQCEISLLTETTYAWLFAAHPAISEIICTPRVHGTAGEMFWQEDSLVASLQESAPYDRVLILSDNLDNCPYFDCGLPFQTFYAELANVPEAGKLPLRLRLPFGTKQSASERLSAANVGPNYAVLHIRAGWPERSPEPDLFATICAHLLDRGLTPVIVGGVGERIEAPGVVNLAGQVSPAESAAIIAGAEIFIGPDSGSLHLASACDVPSLALYAGTSLRLVPPLASQAISQQATSCCARPCGLSPCSLGCSARGFDPEQLCAHVDALLDGNVGEREWFGAEPARLISGPDGPHLLARTPMDASVHPRVTELTARPGPGLEEAPLRAKISTFQDAPDDARRHRMQTTLQAMRCGPSASSKTFTLPNFATITSSSPLQQASDLHCLALSCALREDSAAALRYMVAALEVLHACADWAEPVLIEMRHTLHAYTWPGTLGKMLTNIENASIERECMLLPSQCP